MTGAGALTRRSRSAARTAGKMAEVLLVNWMRSNGAPHAERRLAGAAKDRGDIAGTPGIVYEVKSPGPNQPVRLGPWMLETRVERDNDGAEVGLLIIKARGSTSPAQWYWVTDGATMAELLRRAGWWAR